MLVIHLSEEIKDRRQAKSRVDSGMLCWICRELIEKVLSELAGDTGIDKWASYPQGLKIHQMYRNVYKELIREFGSSEILQVTFECIYVYHMLYVYMLILYV